MTCLMTWLMTGQCGPSVDDVDDESAPTCPMALLCSQARITGRTGFSGIFPAKLRRALQGSFQLRFRRSLYRRTRMEERNLRSWSKARSENFENSATLNRELKKRVFLCLSFPKALIPICCAYWTESKHKENTKQADLRGSPKPGTSTEAADCILMEE